jgi:hypothetical protein
MMADPLGFFVKKGGDVAEATGGILYSATSNAQQSLDEAGVTGAMSNAVSKATESASYVGGKVYENGSYFGGQAYEKGTAIGGTVVGKASEGLNTLEQNDTAGPVVSKGKEVVNKGLGAASWFGSAMLAKVNSYMVDGTAVQQPQ